MKLLYEGKAKRVYASFSPAECIISFKDDATAFNGEKRGTILNKGVINNRLSNVLFRFLEENGIPTHLIRELNERETLVKKVRIVPLEVIVRNRAAGSMAKRMGLEEGFELPQPTIEFSYKNDALGDPLIPESYAVALGLASEEEIKEMKRLALRINELLIARFARAEILLIDFKLEFGRASNGQLLLADEISPDTCRLWDRKTMEKLDKDRFRRDLGNVESAYAEVFHRLSEGSST